jgi:hypothetical protein
MATSSENEETNMSPAEIQTALRGIHAEGSKNAYISVSIALTSYRDGSEVSASFYPDDICGGHHISAKGESFEEAIKALRAAWDEAKVLADKNTIRQMALAIIEISTDQGECSDAALRGAGFLQAQVDRIGSAACEEATRLAAGGPFSIVPSKGANAPHEMEAA